MIKFERLSTNLSPLKTFFILISHRCIKFFCSSNQQRDTFVPRRSNQRQIDPCDIRCSVARRGFPVSSIQIRSLTLDATRFSFRKRQSVAETSKSQNNRYTRRYNSEAMDKICLDAKGNEAKKGKKRGKIQSGNET